MLINVRLLDVASRVAALALVALPAGYLLTQFGAWEAKEATKMSHQQLLDYVREGFDSSFPANYWRILLITLVYVALVEGVALVCRLIVRALRPEEPASEVARKFV
jgi:hypothetical protein